MSARPSQEIFHVAPAWQGVIDSLGLTAQSIFTDPRIKPWRTLPERNNATLDLVGPAGLPTRLHVKRYRSERGETPAAVEARALDLLIAAEIPTLELAGWGQLADGRSFTLTADLAGYTSCQVLLQRGVPFSQIAGATAELAAQLHTAGLHHRDLYLCHFFYRAATKAAAPDCRLIDIARVGRLPNLFARRWVVKDLAQFRFSGSEFYLSSDVLDAWLTDYATRRGLSPEGLKPAILRKVALMARHDARLRARQPGRNISIPEADAPARITR